MPLIYFRTPYTPEALNNRFKRLFKNADIVFLDQAIGGCCISAQSYYDQLSHLGCSALGARDEFFEEFQRKKESFIRGCRKNIEVERSSFSEKEVCMPMIMNSLSFMNFYSGNFKKACKLNLDSAKLSAKINNARDIAIGKQLENLHNANKTKNILALIGGYSEFQIYLDKKGIEVIQEFPYQPYLFGLEDQLERYFRFGRTPTKEKVARSFVGNVVNRHLKKIRIGPPDSISGEIKTAEQLSYEGVEALSKHMSSMGRGCSDSDKTIVAWLENNGVKIYHK